MALYNVSFFFQAAIFSLYLLVAPFLFVVMFYLYWEEIGYIFISGVVVMLLMIRFQAFLGKFFAAFRFVQVLVTNNFSLSITIAAISFVGAW